jgi:hypothetical protein
VQHPVVADRLAMRERARALGDTNLERACNADLSRYGYRETAQVIPMPERTVGPRPKRGRPKLPRCEHGQIVGRCVECDDDLAA